MLEEMRKKTMEGSTVEALSLRGRSISRKKGKPSSGRSKSRGKSRLRSMSLVHSTRRCWTCRNPRHYKNDCTSKEVGTCKDSDMTWAIKNKVTEGEKGDVYLALMSTQMERESWLIESDASFHMTPHRHWFYEYGELRGGDILLGNDSLKKIIG